MRRKQRLSRRQPLGRMLARGRHCKVLPDGIRFYDDIPWLASFDFYRKVCGFRDETESIAGLLLLARHSDFIYPTDQICWLVPRTQPQGRKCLLKLDERERLHSVTGPAFLDDEHAVWAWHGTLVPQSILEAPWEIGPEQIKLEIDPQIRRVMIECYASSRFLAENPEVIDVAPNAMLYRQDFGPEEPLVMLKEALLRWEDNDRCEQLIRVPPNITRIHDAVAWTFGKGPCQFFVGTAALMPRCVSSCTTSQRSLENGLARGGRTDRDRNPPSTEIRLVIR